MVRKKKPLKNFEGQFDEFTVTAEPRKMTPTQKKIQQAHTDGYHEGRRDEARMNVDDSAFLKKQLENHKVAQVKAVTELIKVTTDNLSKAGYLIAKLNGGSGW